MWTAILKDGTKATEKTASLKDIRDGVVGMSFEHRGVDFHLPYGMSDYRCGGTGSALAGAGQIQAAVESRWIQCTLPDGKKVRIRFSMSEPKTNVEIL